MIGIVQVVPEQNESCIELLAKPPASDRDVLGGVVRIALHLIERCRRTPRRAREPCCGPPRRACRRPDRCRTAPSRPSPFRPSRWLPPCLWFPRCPRRRFPPRRWFPRGRRRRSFPPTPLVPPRPAAPVVPAVPAVPVAPGAPARAGGAGRSGATLPRPPSFRPRRRFEPPSPEPPSPTVPPDAGGVTRRAGSTDRLPVPGGVTPSLPGGPAGPGSGSRRLAAGQGQQPDEADAEQKSV